MKEEYEEEPVNEEYEEETGENVSNQTGTDLNLVRDQCEFGAN